MAHSTLLSNTHNVPHVQHASLDTQYTHVLQLDLAVVGDGTIHAHLRCAKLITLLGASVKALSVCVCAGLCSIHRPASDSGEHARDV